MQASKVVDKSQNWQSVSEILLIWIHMIFEDFGNILWSCFKSSNVFSCKSRILASFLDVLYHKCTHYINCLHIFFFGYNMTLVNLKLVFMCMLPYFGKRKQVTYHLNLKLLMFCILPSAIFLQAKFNASTLILLRDVLGTTSWYSIDVSGNGRYIVLFCKKCQLLPFATVGQYSQNMYYSICWEISASYYRDLFLKCR